MNQNLTLSLNQELLKRVKVVAAKKNKSISNLVRDFFQKLVKEEGVYVKAQKKALDHLKNGIKLGGGPYYKTRDELHE